MIWSPGEYLRHARYLPISKANKINLSRLLANVSKEDKSHPIHNTGNAISELGSTLDDTILQDARDAVQGGGGGGDKRPIVLNYDSKTPIVLLAQVIRRIGSSFFFLFWGEPVYRRTLEQLNLRCSAPEQSLGSFL